MGIFRRAQGEPLAVTMAGVKLRDRFLSLGVRDPKLIAALAVKSGLTGRACAVDADPARASAGAAAIEAEGALVEVEHADWGCLRYDDGSFDVALARDVLSTLDPDQRARAAAGVFRVLRGGGRLVVVESTRRTKIDAAALTAALAAAGFAAVRVLAEAEHTIFLEGVKKA
jgi:demethylmenaquinone methyltransferase/2-methoxy-6-polyprenyl-1,4-benzoquinol methylase